MFQPSYWSEKYDKSADELEEVEASSSGQNSNAFEQEPTDLYASVKIRNMTKVNAFGD